MPSNSVQFALRSSLALGSLFVGASIAHRFWKPDLTIPTLPTPAEQASATSQQPVEGFAAAAAFQGARQGFVFKAGPAGLGYYPDTAGRR